jgi:hypothetical protein
MLPIRPMHDGVFIDIIDRDITTKDLGNGKVLHLLSDDHFGIHDSITSKHQGIRPRWARVLAVGPKCEGDVKPGDLVLCDTLKWGRKMPLGRDGLQVVYFWNIKEGDILLVNDDDQGEAFLAEWEARVARLELTIGHL